MNAQDMLKWIGIQERIINNVRPVSDDYNKGKLAILRAMREEILFQLELNEPNENLKRQYRIITNSLYGKFSD